MDGPNFGRAAWKPVLCLLTAVCVLFGSHAAAQTPASTSAVPPPPRWPMEFVKDGARLVVYQPQLQDWNRFRDLGADTAVSITPSGGKPILGVVSWHSTTLVDTQTRIVTLRDITLTNARFPSLDAAGSSAMERLIRDTYPAGGMTIGLDRLLAGVKAAHELARVSAISTKPPVIAFSTTPAILVFVDGEPIRVPIEGTGLEYVVNTNWDLIYDKSDYYLLNQKTWLKAKDLAGPWAVTTRLPPDMSRLPAGESWDDVRQAVPPAPAPKSAPRVVVAQVPTELLLFSGTPAYSGIPNTNLAHATNTEHDVFIHYPDRQLYVLVSGRWFRAAGLQGPWTYAGNDLPKDFARIPPTHPRAHVLASVPGTQAAHDAVLLAHVPTTGIVNRAEAEANVKVAYAGEPKFGPIEGTTLAYAVNTQERVIRYGNLYYLCFHGVWFVSTNPQGPWKTADSVPPAIYEIPPTSPVYNVTYVTVANPTATTVEASYTGGYAGMFVLGAAVGVAIAYGTGYHYAPYYFWGPYPYPVYYPYPYTYGCRAVYNPTTGFYAVGGAVYGPYAAAGRAAWYNPATGRYGRAATVQTAYGGRTLAQAYNPWTGTYAATAQGHNAYAQWGSSVVQRGDDWARAGHVTTDQGTVAHYRTSEGGSGTIISGKDGRGGVVKTGDDTVYAGRDGNVYKRSPDGGWSKYDDGNWTPVERSRDEQRKADRDHAASERRTQQAPLGQTQRRTAVPADTMQQLNNDAAARQRGAARERSFDAARNRSFDRGALGGGARGGRRR